MIKTITATALLMSLLHCNEQADVMSHQSKDPDLLTGENMPKTKGKSMIDAYMVYQFEQQYPEAKQVIWTTEVDSHTVNFMHQNLPSEIVYNDRSRVISERIGQAPNALIPKIKKHILSNYSTQKITGIYRQSANQQRSIVVVLDHKTELYYELSGKFLREEQI